MHASSTNVVPNLHEEVHRHAIVKEFATDQTPACRGVLSEKRDVLQWNLQAIPFEKIRRQPSSPLRTASQGHLAMHMGFHTSSASMSRLKSRHTRPCRENQRASHLALPRLFK